MIHLDFIHAAASPIADYTQKQLSNYFHLLLKEDKTERHIPVELTFGIPLPDLATPASYDLDDQYQIIATPYHLKISASNPRSILLGVYRLLTELGCRFPMPGIEHEYIPQIRLEEINVYVCESASFRHRGVCIEGADSLKNILDFIDWLPKTGCNSFFVQHFEPEVFLNNWYSHKYNPLLKAETLSQDKMEQMCRQIDQAIACRGLLHHRVGHGWTSKAMGIPYTCAPAKMAPSKEQRLLLAQVNGVRDFWEEIPSNTNLCYSNPMAQCAFIKGVTEYAANHPEVDYLHVWLADEYNNVCECHSCRSTSLTDQYISLLNEIDSALVQSGISTHIVLLLYQELLWPPVRQKLVHPERFTLMFAPISRTFNRSYSCRGPIPNLMPYRRNQIVLPHTLEENIAFLEAWKAGYDTDSFVYDYPLGRAHYGDLGYHHIARIISSDIKELSSLKLNGYISCQELRAALPNAFPNYVMGRTLWNKNLSFEILEEEYYSALYGSDWSTVKEYLLKLSSLTSCDYFNGIGPRFNPEQAARYKEVQFLSGEFHLYIRQRLDTAEPFRKIFFSLLDYHTEYCILITKALEAQAAGRVSEVPELWNTFMNFIRMHEPEFQPYLDVYRVLEVGTKYTGFSLDIER